MYVDYRGGVISRPGSVYVGRCLYSNHPTRLVKFQFNVDQTYILEFGHQYMRVIRFGGYVLEPDEIISGITNAAPGVFTSTAHGYSNGDWIFLDDIVGMETLNGGTYIVAGVTTNTFTLTTVGGNAVDTSALGVYVSGGTVGRIFTLSTPYVGTDLALLKFVQANDVVTITHPSYAPRDLTRTEHWAWALNAVSFAASIAAPSAPTLTADPSGGAATTQYKYVVTSISDDKGDESLASTATAITTYSFNPGSGTSLKSITVDWTAVTGAAYYNVYRTQYVNDQNVPAGASYGFIGSTEGTKLIDNNITPDFATSPPKNKNPFNATDKYPGVASYFQQRKVFAATNKAPNTLWLTQTGAFTNMNASIPIRATDALVESLASQESNPIKFLISMPGGLIVLTGGGAWQISGDGRGSPITPTDFDAVPQAYNGSGDVPPIVTNYDILYVQLLGSTVRDLSYNFYANIYTGTDITTLSGHLFKGYKILEWTHAEEPDKVIWAVRDDGRMLSLTYVKEENVYAWAQHETAGLFKSVCSIPEEDQNRVYFVVNRNGVQQVEYFASRLVDSIDDAWSVDAGLRLTQLQSFRSVRGLDHLEGQTVSILANGSVMPQQVVVNGSITLPHDVTNVVIGLPFTWKLQTLYIDAGEPTIQGRRKIIKAVTVRTEMSRGINVGPSFDELTELKERTNQPYGQPIQLTTGDHRINISSRWNDYGQICLSGSDPIPAKILAVIPEVSVGN
jgi:hypothetical protein